MTPIEAVAIVGAGVAAGTINTIVGSGSLITFPTLLLFGYSPLVANVSNTIGLVPGSVSGVIGYRRELVGQRGRVAPLAVAALSGGLSGGHGRPSSAVGRRLSYTSWDLTSSSQRTDRDASPAFIWSHRIATFAPTGIIRRSLRCRLTPYGRPHQ